MNSFPPWPGRRLPPGLRLPAHRRRGLFWANERGFRRGERVCPDRHSLVVAEIITDFEREFNAQGIPTLRAAYQVGSG